MAFPSVDSLLTQQFATDSTTHNVDMPATVASGDLLLVLFAVNDRFAGANVTTPSGWTLKLTQDRGGYVQFGVYVKEADGTEGGTSVNFVTDSMRAACSQLYRISSWAGALTDVEYSTPETQARGTSHDPPPLTPSWGADDTLWIAVAACGDDDLAFTGYPTGFTNGTSVVSGAGVASNNGCSVGTARRENNTTTETPGNFTIGSTESWVLTTVGIKPAAGAGGTTYTQALAGSITPTGSLSDAVTFGLLVTGAITATGAIGKTTKKALTGAVTAAGSVAKGIKKQVAGSITAAGALVTKLIVPIAVAGSITATSTLNSVKTLITAIQTVGRRFSRYMRMLGRR